ncbi:MAG: hypothetical protein ACRCVG_08410 [Methanobacteriaceae archaeon]
MFNDDGSNGNNNAPVNVAEEYDVKIEYRGISSVEGFIILSLILKKVKKLK